MCQTQKEALFNLVVVGLAFTTVLSLYPVFGRGAVAGFGLLGLLGFGPIFYRKHRGQVVADERDTFIRDGPRSSPTRSSGWHLSPRRCSLWGSTGRGCRSRHGGDERCLARAHALGCHARHRHAGAIWLGRRRYEDRSSIKNRIREHRFHNGEMTQEGLLSEWGYPPDDHRPGGREIRSVPPLAFKLADAFNVKVEDVFQYNRSDEAVD